MTISKQFMQRFVEFINTANTQLGEELISPDAIFYAPTSPDPFRGTLGYLAVINMMRNSFPDIQWTLEDLVAENDKIAVRFTMRGTHTGIFFGVEPSGAKIEVQAINFYHLQNGKIIKEYGQPDLLGILRQIGAIPV